MKQVSYVLVVTAFLFAAPQLRAQDDVQQFQDSWGKDKQEIVRIAMQLSAADSVKFWPIYNKYEVERKKIGRERIAIIEDYGNNYDQMTNGKADDIMKKLFKNDAAMTALQQQYYNKMKTSLGAMQSVRFLHLETYLLSTIRSELLGALPAIGNPDQFKSL